jgi:hypothetical protein
MDKLIKSTESGRIILKRPFKHKVIKNFLDKTEVKLLTDYCRIRHRLNDFSFDIKPTNNNADTRIYGDPFTETLLVQKREIMEKETGYKLLPTYSYWRMYTYASNLPKHTDRQSCEISVTMSIGSDGTQWPIYLGGTPITLEHGDAAIYFGCDTLHWREDFKGDWHAQAFLHYVHKDGPFKEFQRDKRLLWGQSTPGAGVE